jgi:hypothetical protein
MSNCPSCNKKLALNAKFCGECGAAQLNSEQPLKQSIANNSNNKLIIALLGIVLIIILLSNKQNEPEAALPYVPEEVAVAEVPAEAEATSEQKNNYPTENQWMKADADNCLKAKGISADYAGKLSNKFDTSISNINFIKTKVSGSSCEMIIDSPKGVLTCTVGGIIWLTDGDYVVTELYAGNEEKTVFYSATGCYDTNLKFY